MKRGIVWVWWVAMLIAVMVTAWLGAVVGGGIGEHEPRLAITVEAPEEGVSILRRGVLVEIGEQPVEPIQRAHVCTVRRAARGPPRGVVGEVHEREP